ncbi:uncharacterized protein ColSpa_08020 [Colletotrichum spaethianum]|uniref:Uncharacterized protein n=1 Tax=Colletotrichum spaethianum TaxID=700344 RepID=A0AA37P8Z5_9PEZI|nr:uncharacterized protein ColSpa_08020 [Colletotrichum spaethianum]GKT47839.1 hypothetical protein ColSpa_08020 [Colletotrichum spaethianum]
MTPVDDTFHLDGYPDTSFDAFVDPNSYFESDACTEGLDPMAESTAQVAETSTTLGGLPTTQVSDFASLFGDDQDISTPPVSTQKQQGPAAGAHNLPLVLPSIEPGQSEGDDLETLFAELSGPIADALQLPTAAPTPVPTCDSLALPTTSWPSDTVDATLTRVPGVDAAELDLFASQPPMDGICDTLDTLNPFGTFSEIKQDLTSSTGFFYPSPQGTEVLPTLPTQPQSTEYLDSLFPDIASAPAGGVPFTYDENSVDLLCSLPSVASLTAPQSVPPRSVPVVAAAAASSTAKLVHPKPRSPNSVSFIHRRSESLTDTYPSSILDGRGLIHVPAASASYLTPAHTPARDLTTPVVDGKVLKRIPKPAKAKDVDASDWYDALPEAPAAWGGCDPKNPMFHYNREGELLPNLRFSREQILYYLEGRKEQGLPLTLWIQNVPHGCKTRVGDDRLRACRWSECPAYKGTILKGFWRVCFDERPATSGKQHDPYHNAGYMHLWCLDRCFDLFEIAHAFDLRPDTRYFEKEERNPMAMTRDHDELVMEFEKWRTSQKAAYGEWQRLCEINKMLGLPIENRLVDKEAKLWNVLTTGHLALETPVRSSMRKKRNGISIDKHKGDLGWYVEKVNEKKVAKKGAANYEEVDTEDEDGPETQVSRLRASSNMKRKSEDREFDNEDGGSHRQATCGSKRPRRSCRLGTMQ